MPRLVSWLLNCVYLTLMLVASPWLIWSAAKHGKYREGFAQKLLGRVPLRRTDRKCIWLHAVSVGEVNLLSTMLNALKQQTPECELVISTTTKTGYYLARRKYAEHTVFYCPLDFSWAVRTALLRLRPDVLVLAELELWPNLIREANRYGAQIAIINGRLSDNSLRGYSRLRPLIAALLRKIHLIAAQNEDTAERFRQLGAPTNQVVVTGSLKFDGAITDRKNPQTLELRALANIVDQQVVFLAGSTQSPEEQYAVEIYQALSAKYPQLRLILVPRHPKRFEEVAQLLESSKVNWIRRSELSNKANAREDDQPVILVDTIGELGAWWGTAAIGFVGGSFGSRGGQNMLEPAAYGAATCFGPNTRNFRDIVGRLLSVEGAQTVNDRNELERFVQQALEDPTWAKGLGSRAQELILAQQGATQRTVDLLLPLIEREQASTSKERTAA